MNKKRIRKVIPIIHNKSLKLNLNILQILQSSLV